jgi:hypothetical protein
MPNITLDLGMEGKGALTDKIFNKGKRPHADLSGYRRDKEGDIDRYAKIDLPTFGEGTLVLPPFFIVKKKVKKGDYYNRAGVRWRLANPLTEIRTLATRKGEPSVNVVRQADADETEFIKGDGGEEKPTLSEFSQRDQNKLIKYFRSIWEGDADDEALPTRNKPRGFPAVLYKNAKKAGYKETKSKVYRKNDLKPKKLPEYKIPAGRPRTGRRIVLAGEDEDEDSDYDWEVVGEPTKAETKVAQEQKKAREERKTAPPITDEEIARRLGLKVFYETLVKNYKAGVSSGRLIISMRNKITELKKEANKADAKKLRELSASVKEADYPTYKLPEPYNTEIETHKANVAKTDEIKKKLADFTSKMYVGSNSDKKALMKEAKAYVIEIKKMFESNAELKQMTERYVKPFTLLYVNENTNVGEGLTKVITEDGDRDDDGGCDGESSGGGILSKIVKTAKTAYRAVKNPKKAFQEVKKFGKNLIYGRLDAYPPSVQKIIDANKDAIVQSITLHRKPLSSTYTTIMSWATGGETDKRIKEQPKDTLYHISMWVKLSNGKTLRVEKNEVIAINPNPKAHKDEQTQEVPPPPAGLTFGDMLEKARKEVGDTKFFGYSAKDNNCGNFIEYILRANGMESKQTKDYIGQDTKTILEGFPTLRKVMNTLTDIAGRANVVLEGGDLGETEEKLSHDTYIDMPSQGGRMLGATHSSVFPAHSGHPALMSDMFPRIPQAFSQVYLSHPRPIGGEGLYAGGSGLYAGGGLYAQGSRGSGSYQAKHIAPQHMGTPMEGEGIFDDIGDAFKFTFSKQGGRALGQAFKPVGSFLIHKGLPAVVSGLAGLGTTLATGNPLAGFAVGQTAGKALGNYAGKALGDATGMGVGKRPRMVKGSAEAKAYMASIRKKRMKGGELPPRSRGVITDPSLLGQGLY